MALLTFLARRKQWKQNHTWSASVLATNPYTMNPQANMQARHLSSPFQVAGQDSCQELQSANPWRHCTTIEDFASKALPTPFADAEPS